jgi:copper(I)-binding protein
MPRFIFLLLAIAFAASARAADIAVFDAWIRLLPAGAPAGGFFTIRNRGARAVTLAGASSSDYAMIMLHQTREEGGVSKMAAVPAVTIPPGGTLSFRPGGYHLMLMEPRHQIAVGSHVPVTLEFAGGGKVTAPFAVRGPAAR